jgi:hypothetical protein
MMNTHFNHLLSEAIEFFGDMEDSRAMDILSSLEDERESDTLGTWNHLAMMTAFLISIYKKNGDEVAALHIVRSFLEMCDFLASKGYDVMKAISDCN